MKINDFMSLSLLFLCLSACDGSEDDTGSDASDTDSDADTDADADSDSDTDTDSDTDEDFSVDCEGVSELLITTPTEGVGYWAGFWTCYQNDNNCSGSSCTWEEADLPDFVVDGDCAAASEFSCTIGGEEIPWCETVENTGYVSVDCSTSGEIGLTVNGLPDHRVEDYSSQGVLPPQIESSVQNTLRTFTTAPVYQDDIEVFTGALGGTALASNGVGIFNQFTGASTVAVTDEILDDCGGHPANGTYHYHAIPTCGALTGRNGSDSEHSGLLGMAYDGFPVFGPYGYMSGDEAVGITRMESCYTLLSDCDVTDAECYVFDQEAYDSGECDLDPCNGRITDVPIGMQDAFGERIYAYYMTIDSLGDPAFPYLPYCYRGEYEISGGGGGGGGGGMGGMGGG